MREMYAGHNLARRRRERYTPISPAHNLRFAPHGHPRALGGMVAMSSSSGGGGGGGTVFELQCVIHEGRHFPIDASFEVRGAFDAEESATGLTRASATPAWGGRLVWRRDADAIRKLQSQGAKLKLTGESTEHETLEQQHL